MSEQSRQEKVDAIMDEFPFGRVLAHMHSVGWEWVRRTGPNPLADNESYAPTEADLRRTARELLRQVVSDPGQYSSVSTGGLTAEKTPEELVLRFVLEEVVA